MHKKHGRRRTTYDDNEGQLSSTDPMRFDDEIRRRDSTRFDEIRRRDSTHNDQCKDFLDFMMMPSMTWFFLFLH